MRKKKLTSSKILTVSCEVALVFFLLWVVSKAAHHSFSHVAQASDSAALVSAGEPGAAALLPAQGTTLMAVIDGAIEPTDPAFTSQRHFRSNLPGDRRCSPFGVVGKRNYDEVVFQNTSAIPQKVTVGFVSSCGNNSYMAAYSPQFIPGSICTNMLAQAGRSGDVVWEFTVCGYTQFSLVVYGLEPGLFCKHYSYSVYGTGIKLLSPQTDSSSDHNVTITSNEVLEEASEPAPYDAIYRKKKPKPDRDTRKRVLLPETLTSGPLIAAPGTPIAAIVTDSITLNDRSFTGQRHFRSGIPGDINCQLTGVVGTRKYDEVGFFNTSPLPQKVIVDFVSFCGFNTYAAAFTPQFTPTNLCAGYLAGQGVSGRSTWEFTICGNSPFSIVVYGLEPGVTCAGYQYTVYGEGIATSADLAISKVATSGSTTVGSNISYLLTVSNNSSLAVGNVTLKDTLPPGTTFVSMNLITEFGTALPAPTCTTPPVGQTGMVSCSLNLLGGQGTAFPNTLTFLLTSKLAFANSRFISNTAFVSHPGVDPLLSNNSSTAVISLSDPFDICLQDESNGNYFKFNSATGQYEFKACASGVILGGTASVTIRGNLITLQQTTQHRRLQVQVDTGTRKGRATIQALAIGATFSITDNDISNNTCTCNR